MAVQKDYFNNNFGGVSAEYSTSKHNMGDAENRFGDAAYFVANALTLIKRGDLSVYKQFFNGEYGSVSEVFKDMNEAESRLGDVAYLIADILILVKRGWNKGNVSDSFYKEIYLRNYAGASNVMLGEMNESNIDTKVGDFFYFTFLGLLNIKDSAIPALHREGTFYKDVFQRENYGSSAVFKDIGKLESLIGDTAYFLAIGLQRL